MHSYLSDYTEGALPQILAALADTNLEQSPGYGTDAHCDNARALIATAIAAQTADIHFVMGGTQANLTLIAAALRPHQAAVCATTGHINVHETGAVEATGHKVLGVPASDGKLCPAAVHAVVAAHTDEHMVQPKLVYISQATELGTVYSHAELAALRQCCDELGLYLFIDGARLGCALTCTEADATLHDIARLSDAFTIGGTKNGALFGEAVIIMRDELKLDFRFMIKQRGGMLAKGRLLGIQFEELFKAGLFFEAARHANAVADKLRRAFLDNGYELLVRSGTNQVFPIIPDDKLDALAASAAFQLWERIDATHSAIRLVTSWATPDSAVAETARAISNL